MRGEKMDPNCRLPVHCKSWEECYYLTKNWVENPPECDICMEEVDKELREKFGDPEKEDN
jgi:hypothetical protein